MSGQVWSTTGHTDGKFYVEVVFGADTPDGAVGLFDEASGTGTMLMAEGHVQETVDGVVTALQFYRFPPLVAGDVVGIRADLDFGAIWFRINGGLWNNGGVAFFEWPNETSSGAHGLLTPYYGSYNLSVDGTTLENMDIPIALVVSANNVTLRNCLIHFDDWYYGVDVYAGKTGFVIENCTIVGPGPAFAGGAQAGINGTGIFTGNNISGFVNGIMLNGPATITGNYIHDLDAAGADPHYDGIQIAGNVPGTLIEGNRILSRDTSCIIIKNDFEGIDDIVINHNYCGSATPLGVGFGVLITDEATATPVTNIVFSNNVMEPAFFETIGCYGSSEVTVSGNIDAFTGEPVYSNRGP